MTTSDKPAPTPTSFEQEFEYATTLCAQARRTVATMLEQVRAGNPLEVEGCLPLVGDIAASVQRNAGALVALARLKTPEDYTTMHAVAVCALMAALALKMGHTEEQVREAGLAGLLLDVGKAKIPMELIDRPGKLTAAEYESVKGHARAGHALLVEAGVGSAIALDVCLHHHERPDGKGYPEALSGEGLSLHARMGAVCDVYDAITSRRAYQDPWGPAESVSLMSKWTKEGQFDPVVFRAFVNCVGIYPVGSLVRLQSDRLAVVVEQNDASPATPVVRAFYSIGAQMRISGGLVNLARPGSRDRIVGRESNREWRFAFLDELWMQNAAPLSRKAA